MRPTGDWGKCDGFGGSELHRANVFSAQASDEFLGSVEPVARQRRTVDQRSRGVYPRPLAYPFDQIGLNGLAEYVPQPLDLSGVLVGDDGHLVAPVENGAPPAGEAIDLPGKLRVEVPHEGGGFLGVVDDQEQVHVARHHEDSRNRGLVAALGSSEDTGDEVVERWAGPKQVASLDGAAGNGDEGPGVGYEPKFSGHTHL